MEEIKTVLIPLGVAIASSSVAAYVAIKVKFATSEEEVLRNFRRMAVSALMLLAVVISFWLLYVLVTSPAPLTRWDVFGIAMSIATIVFNAIVSLIMRVLGLMDRMLTLNERGAAMTLRLIDVVEKRLPGTTAAINSPETTT